jgi:hypothetical protein
MRNALLNAGVEFSESRKRSGTGVTHHSVMKLEFREIASPVLASQQENDTNILQASWDAAGHLKQRRNKTPNNQHTAFVVC